MRSTVMQHRRNLYTWQITCVILGWMVLPGAPGQRLVAAEDPMGLKAPKAYPARFAR
jgi:hypothetical protein